jgi:hypothetical protein
MCSLTTSSTNSCERANVGYLFLGLRDLKADDHAQRKVLHQQHPPESNTVVQRLTRTRMCSLPRRLVVVTSARMTRTRLAATPESHDRGGVKAHRTSAATAEGECVTDPRGLLRSDPSRTAPRRHRLSDRQGVSTTDPTVLRPSRSRCA